MHFSTVCADQQQQLHLLAVPAAPRLLPFRCLHLLSLSPLPYPSLYPLALSALLSRSKHENVAR